MYSFPKIFQLGTVYVQDIFKDEVEITEKIDGSHFKFWLNDNDDLVTYSRGQQIFRESADKLFDPVLEWVYSVKHRLNNGLVYYGETLCRPRHNVLTYNKVPNNHFILFGIGGFKNTKFYSYDTLIVWANHLGCDVVPKLFEGKIEEGSSLTDIVDKYLEIDSYLGGNKIEGIVIKNYHRPSLIGGQIMPIMNAKYVSEAFKEKHSTAKEWLPQTDKINLIFREYRTEARWNKSIQHLKESGELESTPRDIGKLLKEINVDIINDHKEEIKEALWKELHKKYQGCWTNGFAEYYKNYLLSEDNEKA